MAQAANIYANALVKAFAADINLLGDTIKCALLSSGYTPNLTGDVEFSDIRSHEISGAGYTAGGVTLTSKSLTLTAANSWGHTWAGTTFYSYGQIVIPPIANGLLYRCVAAGTTASSAPTFPTVTGLTVVDGTAEWACLGDAILIFTSDPPQWPGATFSANYAVIYDAQSGTYTTEPLIVLETFLSTQSPSSQTYEVLPDPILGWFNFSPPA
jgi:hypothetical protein